MTQTAEAPALETAAPAAPPATLPVTKRELRIVLAALMIAMILASLDQQIVNTALPRMASDLGGLGHISWVVTAFMLCSTISTPLYGKLSDMYGRRRLFVVSISVFLASSMLCGVSQNMVELIGFRALQGLGAGGLMTLSQTVIGDLVSPRERGRYQGLFTGAMAVSSVAGPLIGGVLTSALSWRWVFYVNLPVGATALTLLMIGLRAAPQPKSHQIDFIGAGLLALAAASTLLLLSWGGSAFPWASPTTLGLAATAIALFALFIRQEGRAAEPIMNLGLFRHHSFAVGVVTSGCMAFAMMGSMVFLPLYFQLVLGLSPAHAGFMLLPQIGMMLISSLVGGQISHRYGRIKPLLLFGVGLEALALSLLATFAWFGFALPWFLVALGTLGFGMGVAMPNATVIVQNAAGKGVMGVATATMGFVRSLGGSMGIATSGGVMALHLNAGLSHLGIGEPHRLIEGGMRRIAALSPQLHLGVLDAYRHAIAGSFMISGCVMSLAFILAMTLPGGVLAEQTRS